MIHEREPNLALLDGEIFELHPYVLDHAGLPAALRAIADRCAERMGARITVAVDPDASGPHRERPWPRHRDPRHAARAAAPAPAGRPVG
jgi:hypothetical protein